MRGSRPYLRGCRPSHRRVEAAAVLSFAWLFAAAPLVSAAEDAPAPQGSVEERLRALEAGMESLRKENESLKEAHEELKSEHAQTEQKVKDLLPLRGRFFGYLDFGLFYAMGNGAGIRADAGHAIYPQYADVAEGWVFYGDPLSTAINSRGEPASLDGSRAITFDAINNNGRLSFIGNALNFGMFAGIGENLTVNASIDFIPRGRDISKPGIALGDWIDVKLGYVEYTVPIEKFDLRIYAGKFDSTLGVEYRSMDAPDRLTVTPSLICRYTCGRPLGVKVRARFLDEALVIALAVTNGSNFVENFGFSNEIDTNFFKTVSGRLSYKIPVGAGLDLGVSGAIGAQDFQRRDNILQWHAGGDARFVWRDLELTAEFVAGRALGANSADGTLCGDAPCLRYFGAYLLAGYRVLNWLMPYVRADWRHATHRDGVAFVYESRVLRFTPGVRFDINEQLLVKLEYSHIREISGQPQFNNDVATSSFVVRY